MKRELISGLTELKQLLLMILDIVLDVGMLSLTTVSVMVTLKDGKKS
jgi:hypothetical protein